MNIPKCLEPIQEIVETVLYTAAVRDAVPVSVCLIAPSGAAKSKLIKSYTGEPLHRTDSFTQIGLHSINANDRDGKVRYLMVPDLNPTLSRKPSTVEATCAQLLSYTSDGTTRVDDGRDTKEVKHNPVGIVTAVTPEIYRKQEKKWLALGLRRRIIPVFYCYTAATRRMLHKMVREDRISGSDFPTHKVSLPNASLPAICKTMAMEIEAASVTLSLNLGKGRSRAGNNKYKWFVDKIEEIDPHVTLVKLARAHAMRARRGKVTGKDVDFVMRFLSFTDPERPTQI